MTLAAAGAGGSALADGIDQSTTGLLVDDGACRQIGLQQAHRTLDINADRAGVDVCGRDHDAAHRSAVAAMCIRIEH
jgi:hypothetical protein